MSKALVTVILPVYNGMPYLPAAVESLFAQTQKDVEHIFLDDGSSDGSGEYLEGLKHPNVKLIRGNRQGVGAVRNHGLELCQTEYLALMDADDISLPDRLSAQLAFMQANPSCVMLGTQIDFLIGGNMQRGLPCAIRHEEIEPRLAAGGGVVYPTLVIRTKIARMIGGFRLKGTGEEYDFCVRMAERGTISNLARVLYRYRLHRGSISMTKHVDLMRGSAYAKATALQRRSGIPESSFEEFAQSWRKRGVAEVLSDRVRVMSNMSYRLARINISEGHRALGALQLAVAAGLDPVVASAHLRRLASSTIFQWRAARQLTLEQADRGEEARCRESYEPQGSTKWEGPVPQADELR